MNSREKLHIIEDGLAMKVNSPYCLLKGVRKQILGKIRDAYGCPKIIDETVYIPIKALNALKGEDIVPKDCQEIGENRKYKVLPLPRVEKTYGFKVEFDNMGLITVTSKEVNLNRDTDIPLMLDVMKRFIFEYATPCEVFEDVKAHTDGFKHPYILIDSKKFDELRHAFCAKETDADYDEFYTQGIKKIFRGGEGTYKSLAKPNKTENGEEIYDIYIGMKPESIPKNPNNTEDGYDIGGRINVPTRTAVGLAFNYQLSGNIKYAKLTYDYLLAFGDWQHWGSGHFLNCASATQGFAEALDWCYNAFVELYKEDRHYDVRVLEDILFEKGVKMGYMSNMGMQNPNHRLAGDAAFYYKDRRNNWNAVCTDGMTTGALVLLSRPEYRLESSSLISMGLYYLANNGLDEYAPDGSYEESASYWCYGSNNLFHHLAVLPTATGKDYGYHNMWGLDRTCYFATNVESSDFRAWGYNDGAPVNMDTCWFNFVASIFDDDTIRKIRLKQIENGKRIAMPDILFYKKTENDGKSLPLFYKMEGMDGFTVRSSWEKGSVFAGLLGGGNNVSHGQIDSGTFTYNNKGKIWFWDLGNEYYNVWEYFSHPNYYRRSAEGNNDICLIGRDDIPYGQDEKGKGYLEKFDGKDNQAYGIIDNNSVFGKYAERAKRGMRIHSDETVVLQDEIDFKESETSYWFAIINNEEVNTVELTEDKKTVYLTATGNDGKDYILRCSIVSEDNDLKFNLTDCYDFKLKSTIRKGVSEQHGGQPEFTRDNFQRLNIKFENKKTIKLAVVMEIVKDKTEAPVSYKLEEMECWKIS